MNYKGSCHCGRVAIEVEGELGGVASCNCSMCQRKGMGRISVGFCLRMRRARRRV